MTTTKDQNRDVPLEEIALYARRRCSACDGRGFHFRLSGVDYRQERPIGGRPVLTRIECKDDKIACGCALRRWRLRLDGKLSEKDCAAIDAQLCGSDPLGNLQRIAAEIAKPVQVAIIDELSDLQPAQLLEEPT